MDIRHKKGDTFIANCVYKDPAGNPIDMVAQGISVQSAVRLRFGTFPLTVTTGSTTGAFTLQSDTDEWNVGRGQWDIKYIKNGIETSSELVSIHVYEGATP